MAFLDTVAKSPLLNATEEVRENLQKHLKTAKAAAASGKWRSVVKALQAAKDGFGRCPERDALNVLQKQVDDWKEAQYAEVAKAAVNGDSMVPAKKLLLAVKRAFAGLPEEEVAATGITAIPRLNFLRTAEARPNVSPDLRDSIAAEFAGTRWTVLFAKPGADEPAPGEKGAGKSADKSPEKSGCESPAAKLPAVSQRA